MGATFSEVDAVVSYMRDGWSLYKPQRRGTRAQLVRHPDGPTWYVAAGVISILRRRGLVVPDPRSSAGQDWITYILKPGETSCD